jgi:hypothetical protein
MIATTAAGAHPSTLVLLLVLLPTTFILPACAAFVVTLWPAGEEPER